jgi:hypothetical protein
MTEYRSKKSLEAQHAKQAKKEEKNQPDAKAHATKAQK